MSLKPGFGFFLDSLELEYFFEETIKTLRCRYILDQH